MAGFSPKLITDITQYFEEKYQVTLTVGEAEEYLNSWADLWRAVSGGAGGVAGKPQRGDPTAGGPTVILDSLHT